MDTTIEQRHDAAGTEGPREADTVEDATWCRDIAARIGAGDPAAETLLVERLRPGIRMVLYSRCPHDAELAADICQDTLVIVLKRLRSCSIDDPSRIAAFAGQTARQLAFDARRRFAIRNTVIDSAVVDASNVETPADDSVEHASLVALVQQLLAELSHDRDREILRRFYLLEQEKSEICQFFGLAPGTFDQLVFRARARFRALLNLRGVASRDLMCIVSLWVPKSWH